LISDAATLPEAAPPSLREVKAAAGRDAVQTSIPIGFSM